MTYRTVCNETTLTGINGQLVNSGYEKRSVRSQTNETGSDGIARHEPDQPKARDYRKCGTGPQLGPGSFLWTVFGNSVDNEEFDIQAVGTGLTLTVNGVETHFNAGQWTGSPATVYPDGTEILIVIDDLSLLTAFNGYGQNVAGSFPDFTGADLLTEITINDTWLTGDIPDLSVLPSLKLVTISQSPFTGFAGGLVYGTQTGQWLGAEDCSLTQEAVDAILISSDNDGLANGTLDLENRNSTPQTDGNSPPSAAGLAAKANLEGRGCTVDVAT